MHDGYLTPGKHGRRLYSEIRLCNSMIRGGMFLKKAVNGVGAFPRGTLPGAFSGGHLAEGRLALVTQSAQRTALLAANIGGDSDSVASIGGAIAGALHPETVNQEWFEVVKLINEDGLLDVAMSLAAVRRGA